MPTISITWADALISLFIGIVGSVIATFFVLRVPRRIARLSTFWAERSKKAAQARVSRLDKKISTIEVYEVNPSAFIGWVAGILSKGLLSAVASILLLLMSFIGKADYALDKLLIKLELLSINYLWGIDNPNVYLPGLLWISNNFVSAHHLCVALLYFN